MKRLLFTLALGLLLSIPTQIQAQYKRVGVRAGVNLSNLRVSNQTELNADLAPSTLVGATGGFLFQSSKNGYFVTNFGLLYSGKGSKFNGDTQVNLHYIQMPLVFNFRIPIAGPVYFKAGFGPYIGYSFLGSLETEGYKNEDIFSIKRKTEGGLVNADDYDDIKPFNPFDAGIMFGGDVEINLPNNTSLDVRFDYEIGMWKTSNDYELGSGADAYGYNDGLKNNTMRITVAYLFDVTGNASQSTVE